MVQHRDLTVKCGTNGIEASGKTHDSQQHAHGDNKCHGEHAVSFFSTIPYQRGSMTDETLESCFLLSQ